MNGVEQLKKRVSGALLWNTFEAFLYQGVLLGHQLMLYFVADKTVFGAQGALFASAYLLISIFNFSLDSAMTSCFLEITQNKNRFGLFLKRYFFTQTFFLLTGSIALIMTASFVTLPARFVFFKDPIWGFIMVLFIASEGTKKNLRALLHLAFKNKATASIEVINIVSYVGIIWLLYFLGISFSLPMLTIPFVIISLCTNTILLKKLYDYYQTLPPSNKIIQKDFHTSFLQTRGFLYINELSRSLFSTNFLLPFFACFNGLLEAGTAALINTITHSVTFFIQKIFGPSGAALFANAKQLSFKNKQSAFAFLQQKTIFALGSLLLFCCINIQPFIVFKIGSQSVFHWTLLYTFFLSHFLENIFVVYEKLFIAEGKAHYITFCNGLSFIGCILVATFLYGSPLITILICFMLLRFGAFIGLALCAKKIWGVSFLKT